MGVHGKCVCNFCSNIVKERFSCNGFSQVMEHRQSTMNSQQTSKHGVKTHVIAQGQKIQKCAFCWQSDVDAVLEP
jgi:hypothetical protein